MQADIYIYMDMYVYTYMIRYTLSAITTFQDHMNHMNNIWQDDSPLRPNRHRGFK